MEKVRKEWDEALKKKEEELEAEKKEQFSILSKKLSDDDKNINKNETDKSNSIVIINDPFSAENSPFKILLE